MRTVFRKSLLLWIPWILTILLVALLSVGAAGASTSLLKPTAVKSTWLLGLLILPVSG